MSNVITDQAYADWAADVKALGGVATAWPFGGPVPVTDPTTGIVMGTNVSAQYGQPTARFPASVFAAMAGQTVTAPSGRSVYIPMANGVQFTASGSWAYVLASVMTGSSAVDNSAQAMTNATDAEAEGACAANDNCSTHFEQDLMTYAKWAAIGLAAYLTLKVVKTVT